MDELNIDKLKKGICGVELINLCTSSVVLAEKDNGDDYIVKLRSCLSDRIDRLNENIYQIENNIKINSVNATKSGDDAKLESINNLHNIVENTKIVFNDITKKISYIDSNSLNVGYRLGLHKNKIKRAKDSKELIKILGNLIKENEEYEVLDFLNTSESKAENIKTSTILRRLHGALTSTELGGRVAEKFEKMTEEFEKRMLEKFSLARKQDNLTLMKDYSEILRLLNGGNSCFQSFISQHRFFEETVDPNSIKTPYDKKMKDSIDLLNPLKPTPALTILYNTIRRVCKKEWEVIKKIFSNPNEVMDIFVQRIFAQFVQVYCKTIIIKAKTHSQLAFVNTFCAIFIETKNLIADIKNIYEIKSKHQVKRDNLLKDCFNDYIHDNKYIKQEIELLRFLINIMFYSFNGVNPNNSSASLVRRGTDSFTIPKLFHKTLPSKPLEQEPHANIYVEKDLYYINGEHLEWIPSNKEKFNIILMENAIRILFQGIMRLEAIYTDKYHLYLTDMLRTFFEQLEHITINLIINHVINENVGINSEPTFECIMLACTISKSMYYVQLFFQKEILVRTLNLSRQDFQTILRIKNSFFDKVAGRIDTLLRKDIERIKKWVSLLLSKQSKHIYNEDSGDLEDSTVTCAEICNFLSRVSTEIKGNFRDCKSNNYVKLTGIICSTFLGLLTSHISKLVVSSTGAIKLIKDIINYKNVVSTFNNKELYKEFETLRHISNVFLVKRENLADILNDEIVRNVDDRLIYSLLRSRSDYKNLNLNNLYK